MFAMGNDCEIHKSIGSTMPVQYIPYPLTPREIIDGQQKLLIKVILSPCSLHISWVRSIWLALRSAANSVSHSGSVNSSILHEPRILLISESKTDSLIYFGNLISYWIGFVHKLNVNRKLLSLWITCYNGLANCLPKLKITLRSLLSQDTDWFWYLLSLESRVCSMIPSQAAQTPLLVLVSSHSWNSVINFCKNSGERIPYCRFCRKTRPVCLSISPLGAYERQTTQSVHMCTGKKLGGGRSSQFQFWKMKNFEIFLCMTTSQPEPNLKLGGPEYTKFAGLVGHDRWILKMSGKGVWSGQTSSD